ncbi:Scr1 family TA system antitoxin-like transcriptional regulator [Streptomyces sp. NPDC086787]|uniref:helix-turn-helix domain-containing protein n=1 Tax=Streptomyces sp. NPDC086787 TaxID=3365759 RepID=UPI003827450F
MARNENKETASPTARLVAALIKTTREKLKLTQPQMGKRIGYSGAAISAAETCAQPASPEMLVALEREFGGGGFDDGRKLMLKEKYPPQFKDFAMEEAEAVSLASYQTYVIDGLFQTPEYARALIGGGFPKLSDEKVEELVKARIARRALLDGGAVIELILDESALLRPIGSPEIMRAQLLSLAADAQRDNVTIQVLSMDRGLRGDHAGAEGNMVLVTTKSHQRLAYLEIEDESILISDPGKVVRLTHRYGKIRAQALSPDESLSLIRKLAGEEQP